MTRFDYLTLFSKIIAYLPAIIRVMLARLIAGLLIVIPNRRRARAQKNLHRCLPNLSIGQEKKLLHQHLLHRALSVLESAFLWHAATSRLPALISNIEGREILNDAHAHGRGVILAVPHFGQWELVGLYLSAVLDNTAILYKPLSDQQADARLREYRQRTGGLSVPASAAGVRSLMKVLREGGYVGILPDQRPKLGHGLPASFFGQDVLTMTLLSRLARKTQSVVVFAGCERDADFQHFTLRFSEAPPGIGGDDELQALNALNQGVEDCAHWNLAQYQWSYKRFDDV